MEKRYLSVSEFLNEYPILKKRFLAEKVGVTPSMMSAYSKEVRNPTEYTVKKINGELQKFIKELSNIELI